MFELDNKNYLVTVDYYSNFWEVDRLEKTKSKDVIKKLKQHFARYGIPATFISDNVPQFVSDEFKKFSQKREFDHITSSAGYAQSNGMAESAVKNAKRLIKKAKKSGTDPLLAVLDHRNTPTEGIGSSPVQRLMSKRMKTLLPTQAKLLEPKTEKNAKEKLDAARKKQDLQYNKTAREQYHLTAGQTMRIQPLKKPKQPWEKAEVQYQVNHRSYQLLTENGNSLRRNRRHLKATQERQVETTTDKVITYPGDSRKEQDKEADRIATPTPEKHQEDHEYHQEQQREMKSTPAITRTRSGRIVKPPSYLIDGQG